MKFSAFEGAANVATEQGRSTNPPTWDSDHVNGSVVRVAEVVLLSVNYGVRECEGSWVEWVT